VGGVFSSSLDVEVSEYHSTLNVHQALSGFWWIE
jgi:hypothetical protein